MKWLRHPKTTQEIRINTSPENKKFVRGKRRKKHLPNSWDDIFIDQVGKKNKSWKNTRKSQYKPKEDVVLYHATTIDEAIHALKAFKQCGIVYVGFEFKKNKLDMVQFDYVFVDKEGNVVGTEAENYKPKENEVKAVRIS